MKERFYKECWELWLEHSSLIKKTIEMSLIKMYTGKVLVKKGNKIIVEQVVQGTPSESFSL